MKITQEQLKRLVHYDPETGVFTSLKNNKPMGFVRDKYIVIRLLNHCYAAHRMAYLYQNGVFLDKNKTVDHINGNSNDNRWENLRIVTPAENAKNRNLHKSNKTGFNGVNWSERQKKWRAQISIKKKNIHLGYFTNKDAAIAARQEANIKYGFHVNHGKPKDTKKNNFEQNPIVIEKPQMELF